MNTKETIKKYITTHQINEEIKSENLANLEQFINKTLPLEYKDFLTLSNGGTFFDGILSFYKIPLNNEIPNLENKENIYIENSENVKLDLYTIPDNLLIIGNDMSGDLICVDIKNNIGEITIWDHEINQKSITFSSFDELFTSYAKIYEKINK